MRCLSRTFVALTVVLCGCSLDGFRCDLQSACGSTDVCIDGSCAAVYPACTSGYRWDDSAGSRANECAPTFDASVRLDLSSDGSLPDSSVQPDLAPPFVCGANAYCLDFEPPTNVYDDWNLSSAIATPAIDQTKPHHGQYGWHITVASTTSTTNGNDYAFLEQKTPWFGTTGDYWMRLWLYVASPAPSSGYNQLFVFQQSAPTGLLLQTATDEADDYIYNNLLDGAVNGRSAGGSLALATDKWLCIEQHVAISDNGPVELFVNGESAGSAITISTDSTPPPDLFALEFSGTSGPNDPNAHELWYDDVVLATTRIGCEFEP